MHTCVRAALQSKEHELAACVAQGPVSTSSVDTQREALQWGASLCIAGERRASKLLMTLFSTVNDYPSAHASCPRPPRMWSGVHSRTARHNPPLPCPEPTVHRGCGRGPATTNTFSSRWLINP